MSLCQFAGQLCTFSIDADPERLPKFMYTDLRATFEELFARMTALLLSTIDSHFISVPLQAQDNGMHIGGKARVNPIAKDVDVGEKLWALSESITGLRYFSE